MTENFSTPNLDKDNSFTYLTDSQKRFNERSVTVGLSTPTSSINNLNPDEARNSLKKVLLQTKNERLKAKMDQSNKINDNQNKENYDLNISKSSNDFIIKKENDELISESKNKGEIAVYKKVKNKWENFDPIWKCCKSDCVNTDSPNIFCIKGNGFAQIKSGTKIKYINNCKGINKDVVIKAMNNFNKSKEELYWISNYFEVELNFEENEKMEIGLLSSDNQAISLWPSWKLIYYYFQLKRKKIKLPSFTYKTNDIIGCGLVYPPLNMTNKLPYVFFTQNGKQIGKAILLKENYETFKPFVGLLCCSIDANFGDNYSKPFVYDIYKHYVTEEFYEKEEFSDD